ncbi:hypothetical protein TBK1r_01850 [Stieleria magnilauensis]|uniref:Uncharacterized protein n=1 Tax=Stieleria magnilauensis TaxID=2527963 RepID=A0ABX5XH00_9BACT|nr:hypothetical protein TBK1r_01850 [Planctomycetes bacterium TBK1r]
MWDTTIANGTRSAKTHRCDDEFWSFTLTNVEIGISLVSHSGREIHSCTRKCFSWRLELCDPAKTAVVYFGFFAEFSRKLVTVKLAWAELMVVDFRRHLLLRPMIVCNVRWYSVGFMVPGKTDSGSARTRAWEGISRSIARQRCSKPLAESLRRGLAFLHIGRRSKCLKKSLPWVDATKFREEPYFETTPKRSVRAWRHNSNRYSLQRDYNEENIFEHMNWEARLRRGMNIAL